MKFDQLIEYNVRNIYQNPAENEAGKLVPDLFSFDLNIYIR